MEGEVTRADRYDGRPVTALILGNTASERAAHGGYTNVKYKATLSGGRDGHLPH